MRTSTACILGLFPLGLFSQSPAVTYTNKKDSDPKARTILRSVSNKMKLDQGVTLDFSLITQAAESKPESQKGKAQIKGEQFNLELPDRNMISDGKTLWVYLKNRNEIQIQDAGTITADPISPYRLIKIHDSPEFVYIWTGEIKNNGNILDIIEFKPLDNTAEYFKIRVEVDRAKSVYKKITLFFKSGDQYTLQLSNQVNSTLPATLFNLDPKSYPGAHIEDLR